TSTSFTGQVGHTYQFYSRARDNVGNLELAPPTPDAKTTIVSSANGVDLQVTTSDGASTAQPGSRLTYTLSYRNGGTVTATGVALTEVVPAGTTFFGGTSGWRATFPGSSVYIFNVGTLAPNAQHTVTFVVTVKAPPALTGVSQISDTATISDDGKHRADVNPSNNTGADVDTLNKIPDLQVAVSNGNAAAVAGQPIAYTITYSNIGDQIATGVTLT